MSSTLLWCPPDTSTMRPRSSSAWRPHTLFLLEKGYVQNTRGPLLAGENRGLNIRGRILEWDEPKKEQIFAGEV